MAVPPPFRSLSRLVARAYGRRADVGQIAEFLDEAIADAWRTGGWLRVASLVPLVLRDLAHVWLWNAPQPLSSPARSFVSVPTRRSSMRDRLRSDLRDAVRSLRQSPGFAAVAVLTLALGIGASTAVYAVVDGAILRPFPYPDMDRIAILTERNRDSGQMASVAWPNFVDWRARNDVFRELGIYRTMTLNMTAAGEPERVQAALVSASVFETMAIAPLRGRAFTAGDDEPTVGRIAVISERLWTGRLGARSDIVGAAMVFNDESYTVVGVMPATMRFPSRTTDVWLPVGLFVDGFPDRGAHPSLFAVGRLKPGVTFDRSRAAMDVIARQLEQEYPQSNRFAAIVVDSYHELVVADIRPAMQLVLGAVGLLLLIGCANLAGLLLARAEERHRDLAIRSALGARRGRLITRLLAEGVLLSAAGGAAGVLLAQAAVRAFIATRPNSIPRIDLIGIDWRVLTFALIVSAGTVVLFALLPAVRASRPDLQQMLRDGRTGASSRSMRLRRALVVAQIGVAAVLLVGAGLLVQSLGRLLAIDVGFDASQVVTMRVAVANARYPTPEAWTAFHARLVDGLAATPGVGAIGINSALPLEGGAAEAPVMKEGDPPPGPDSTPRVMCLFQTTSGAYFDAMGIPIVRGRVFDGRDGADGPRVVVVDEALVAKLFPNVNPIGKRISFEAEGQPSDGSFTPLWREIVGVVGTVKHYGLLTTPPYVQLYVPHTQLPYWQRLRRPAMAIVARAADGIDADAIVSSVRRTVRAIDPTLPVYNVRPMREYVDAFTEQQRLASGLLAAFGALALALALVGVYGMLSYVVALRTREIGVRMALGARRGDVVRQVVGQGLRLAAAGIGIGIALAMVLSRFVEALLYQVSPRDPGTYLVVATALGVVAALASAIPARRASAVDPAVVLK